MRIVANPAHPRRGFAQDIDQVLVSRPKFDVEQLGGQITRTLINHVVDGTFFARIVVDLAGRQVEVDSRPSDAIAVALRVGAPIFAEEAVLDRSAIIPESASAESASSGVEPAERIPEEQLAIFRDVIEHLTLDDLGGKR